MAKRKRKDRKRPPAGAPAGKPGAAPAPEPPGPQAAKDAPRLWVTLLIWLAVFPWILSYTPSPIAWGAWPGLLAALVIIERGRSLKEVILWLALFGTIATGIGYAWLAGTVQRFGGLPAPVSWVLLVLFGAWNVVHGFLFAWLYRGLLARGRRPHPLVTAVVFVACETLPIRMFGWMIGHGGIDVPAFAQAAEWGGVAGVSIVMICLILPFREWIHPLFRLPGPPPRPRAAAATFLVGLTLAGAGALRAGQVEKAVAKADRSLRVAIVQGNVGSVGKRMASAQIATWRRKNTSAYTRQTEAALERKPDLIVWPETAITDRIPISRPEAAESALRRRGFGVLNEAAKTSALLVGMYEPEESPGPDRRYNVAALRTRGPEGEWSSYRKVYLIPFGETTPFGLFDDQLPQPFKMLPGPSAPALLELDGVKIAAFICYEAILPGHVRSLGGGERPDLLVNLTNDSWFGDTWEPHQHLNFTRFRAIEHRAPLVRATNTGISAFVSPTGKVEDRLELGVEGILVRDVPVPDRGKTIYESFGYLLPWLLWVAAATIWLRGRRERRAAEVGAGPDAA